MTEREKEIAHLKELQAKHRQNIRTLEEMLANYGMERPLPLVNNLDFEQEQLRIGMATWGLDSCRSAQSSNTWRRNVLIR